MEGTKEIPNFSEMTLFEILNYMELAAKTGNGTAYDNANMYLGDIFFKLERLVKENNEFGEWLQKERAKTTVEYAYAIELERQASLRLEIYKATHVTDKGV
jgi:hypothetical protein